MNYIGSTNMKSKIKILIKLSCIVAIIIFILLYNFKTPEAILDYWDLILESAGYSIIMSFVYEKYLWKYKPMINIPKLNKKYNGVLNYYYKGKTGEKTVEIEIKQTFLSTKVKLKSDEMNSKTITSELIEENEEFVLYYTYITNPSSKYIDNNPIQIGTCKLIVDDVNDIKGSYWTNRKTIGDLHFHSN